MSRTEAFLRNGSETVSLADMLARVMWQECADVQQDLASLRDELVTAICDYAVLRRKHVNLERLCQMIEVKERDGRVMFSLPAEVTTWLTIP